jgi:alkylhydroperoxidase/carboxymuconolactone decarboxylase family protein YurZ
MTEPTPIDVPPGLRGIASFDPGAIDALRNMRLDLERRSPLDERTTELIRLGALVALQAPAESFTAHVVRLRRMGVPPEEIWGAVISVAPMTGVPPLIHAGPAIEAALAEADTAT